MASPMSVRCHTGQSCPITGVWRFDGYLDGTRTPSPKPGEWEIALAKTNVAPPIHSENKGCYWLLIRRA